MKGVLQTLMSCIGAVGFAVLFNIHGKKLFWVGFGGALGWAMVLTAQALGASLFAALLLATAAVAALSEVLARRLKAPVIMLLVPMLIPMIPGGDLYHMMSFLVSGQYESFVARAQLVLQEAGAIAMGILCVASAVNLLVGLRRRAAAEK